MKRPKTVPLVFLALFALALPGRTQAGYEWGHEFDTPHLGGGDVRAFTVFDDGSGPVLIVGGQFFDINGETAYSVASFDGKEWAPLGAGLGDGAGFATVNALEVYDPDGPGPGASLLVAAGKFTTANGYATPAANIAAWDGVSWSPLGGGLASSFSGLGGPEVLDLQAYDDGSGPKLFAVGPFSNLGYDGIATWDGSAWGQVGWTASVGGWPRAIEAWDDGSGEALYFGGSFDSIAGSLNTKNMARWDGTSWTSVGAGFGSIQALSSFDPDGAGPLPGQLVAIDHGDLEAWDGSTLRQIDGPSTLVSRAITAFDDGSGEAIYFGASSVGGASIVRRWDGVATTSTSVGSPLYTVLGHSEMSVLFGYAGELHLGGRFGGTALTPSYGHVKWNGNDWGDVFERKGLALQVAPGSGSSFFLAEPFVAGAVAHDVGFGVELFVGGDFTHAGPIQPSSKLAAWNGSSWRDPGAIPAGGGIQTVTPLAVYDDGSGPALYVGVQVFFGFEVYRLDALGWTSVGPGSGAFAGAFGQAVVFDDGNGPELFVVAGNSLHRWNGSSWSVKATTNASGFTPLALEVYDDGISPELMLGGDFTNVGGQPIKYLAGDSGGAWHKLGFGVGSPVTGLKVLDEGSGPVLMVSGEFSSVPLVPGADHIARWDGTLWTSVGGGDSSITGLLGVHDDGAVERLYAVVQDPSTTLVGTSLRAWDGVAWQTVPSSTFVGALSGMTEYDDGTGSYPYVWGWFHGGGGQTLDPLTTIDAASQASGIVRWGPPTDKLTVSGSGCSLFSTDIPTIHGLGVPAIGSSAFVTTVRNVPPGLPAVLTVGTSTDFWQGLPLPVDFGFLGWSDCSLQHSWDYTFWTSTSGSGVDDASASLALTIPNLPILVGLELGLQWGILFPAPTEIQLGLTPLGELTIE